MNETVSDQNHSSEKIEQRDSHERIVNRDLPYLAKKLKEEGVISAYNRKPFVIPTYEGGPALKIYPDLILYMPDKRKVAIEVANPKDPKRFIGEMLYSQLLGYHKKISAVIIYVIHTYKEKKKHARSFGEIQLLHEVFEHKTPLVAMSWTSDESILYNNLKILLTSKRLGLPKIQKLISKRGHH